MRKSFVQFGAAQLVVLFLTGMTFGQAHFTRGDTNHDGTVNIADSVYGLGALFGGGAAPPCADAADVNDDGEVNIADPVFLLNHLFTGSEEPPFPFHTFEGDPTPDNLGCLGEPVELTGDITADRTLTNDTVYRLVSGVFVKSGATLTIEAGVTILGDSATEGLLVVERGAQLVCNGTATRPVVFTSDRPVGERGRGDWGGLILLGRGDNNLPNKEGLAEGLENQRWGGGTNVVADDSSGKLSYVRVEFGGTEISMDNEVNSISLFGTGSGTELDHVQVKYNLDDGFEWFGGSSTLKYGMATGIGDDSFDYSFGWNGSGQFWLAQQRGDDADNGFEVDNSEDEFGARPLTRPMLSNLTLIGDPSTDPTRSESDLGLQLRRGCGGLIYNAIVMGFKDPGLDLDDGITTENIDPGDLVVDYSVFYMNGADGNTHWATDEETPEAGFVYTTTQFATEVMQNNIVATESPVVDGFNLDAPNFRPQNDALTAPFDPTELNNTMGRSFFSDAPYRGAVPPEGDNWTEAPWISYLGE